MLVAMSDAGAQEAVAYATMGLALITVASLFFGWSALRAGQREAEEAHRPVVVPVADRRTIQLPGRPDRQAAPKVLEDAALFVVPVENVGSGAALELVGVVRPLGGPVAADALTSKSIAGLGEASMQPLWFVTAPWLKADDGTLIDLEITLSYADVGRRSWSTSVQWDAGKEVYGAIAIDRRRAADTAPSAVAAAREPPAKPPRRMPPRKRSKRPKKPSS